MDAFSDGIDGKQARRTKTSSPLGELFDHGLDSWATLFLPVGLYSIFGRGEHGVCVYRVYLVIIGIMFCFVVSHWEKYNTGILFLPWGYDIGQIVSHRLLVLFGNAQSEKMIIENVVGFVAVYHES